MKVDEYAENLKNGKEIFPVDDKSYELSKRIKELEFELKGTNDLSHISQLLHKLLENRGGQDYNKFLDVLNDIKGSIKNFKPTSQFSDNDLQKILGSIGNASFQKTDFEQPHTTFKQPDIS